MKKIYYLVLLFGIPAIGQIINIPDANFKASLLNHTPIIDTNTDGEIQVSEATVVTHLNLSHKNIASLSGLENFTNLTQLNCSFNNLSSFSGFDFPSLQDLQCQNNNISLLNIDLLPLLYQLICDNNQVTSIDLHNNHYLNSLFCSNNLLSEINLCGTQVSWLYCDNNPNLTYISVKNNVISIVLGGRNTTAEPPVGQFEFYNCPQLATVCYDEGELYPLEWTLPFFHDNINLVTDCALDCVLNTKAFMSDSYTLAPNPVANVLNITAGDINTKIQAVTIYNALGQFLQTVSGKTSIDVSTLKTGTYLIEINSDKGKTTKKFIKL